MKNIIRNICHTAAAFVMLLSAASCLDKFPASSIADKDAMKTFSDAEQHVVGIYASLKSSYLYSGLLTLLPDIQADLVYAVDGNSNTYGKFWQWEMLPTDVELENVYGSLYGVSINSW